MARLDQPIASTSTSVPLLKKTKTPKASKSAPLKPSASAPPLGKFLASSEKHIRDKAVASLSKFLSAGNKKSTNAQGDDEDADAELVVGDLDWSKECKVDKRLAPLEMAKLWKGIFFCFWMSDKPLVQQALAQALANLTLDVRPKSKTAGRVERFRAAMCYLRGFWEAVVREWSGLDRLRLDKFYLLIRRFVHAAFMLLKREEWDPTAIAEYNALLTGPGGPLHVEDSRIPASLGYHLADIYLTELERAFPLSTEAPSARTLPLRQVLQPFLTTLALSPTSTLFNRVTENVITPLLDDALPAKEEPARKRRKKVVSEIIKPTFPGILGNATEADEPTEVEEGEMGEKEKVGRMVLKAIFEEGGKKETNEVNRRRLYLICREREEGGVEL
ncbi:nucleolar protein,Nop52-domain-containing protein [Leucosporidium creatinivorum]|uniref:Nucleolar protein,Nop52-domain-containing protein n=1 Tax=Leucosporidium creatinivorum TaxID=106004 RepID=A0A1Y2ELI3_9BASI|nr:nucleolar protein,Nop52-domain-containing protein [Leucosporidium creatinivorum]